MGPLRLRSASNPLSLRNTAKGGSILIAMLSASVALDADREPGHRILRIAQLRAGRRQRDGSLLLRCIEAALHREHGAQHPVVSRARQALFAGCRQGHSWPSCRDIAKNFNSRR